MKGIVFSEFADLVEEKFSPEMYDEIIMESDLPSGGAYTAVGTYEHAEMVQLVSKLSEKTAISVADLLYTFGEHLAERFASIYPIFFQEAGNVFDFMKSLNDHIHVEVLKLYPDADLPHFSFDDSNPDCLVLEYTSERGMADLANGLMNGAIAFYGENISVKMIPLEGSKHVRFELLRG